jgi:polyhydroxybutyrate depolymerase
MIGPDHGAELARMSLGYRRVCQPGSRAGLGPSRASGHASGLDDRSAPHGSRALPFGEKALAAFVWACGSDGGDGSTTGPTTGQPGAAGGSTPASPASAGKPGGAAGATTSPTSAGRAAVAPSAGRSSGGAGVTPDGVAPSTAGASGGGGATSAPAAGSGESAGASGAPMMTPVGNGDPMPSPGCSGGMLRPGRMMGSIMSSGGNRNYIQYVPQSYDGTKPIPMVFDLHPYSVNASFSESSSGFRQLADSEGYIYIAPNGIGGEWDANGDTDEKFIRDLVGSLSKDGCIDLRRIYATGCSNGGAFSFLLMCTAEDIFAAVAPMCGTAFFDLDTMCMMDRPVSIQLRLGLQDTLNCWEGEGRVLDAPNVPAGTRVPCAKTVQMILSQKYHCTGSPVEQDGCEFVSGCDQGTEISICGERTGHVVYSSSTASDTWAFLKKFYKP